MPKKKIKKIEKVEIQTKVPVVAVMGHVDHGKTSILDAIRDTKVQEGELGGITQNTRAHLVTTKDGKKFTFIDTPGHEAFSSMRSRGARVTDIVLLVVAADDGVKPQTIESIKFAKEAKVPIVVAVNKMDTPGANIDKVKQELSQHDILVEDFGGDVLISGLSATKKQGLDEMLENISLQVEILDLKKQKLKDEKARAFVLESNMDPMLGPVALVIVKAGEIKSGNVFLDNGNIIKVREVLNEVQKSVDLATEGEPIWLIGLKNVLATGQTLDFFEDEKQIKSYLKKLKKEEKKTEEKVAEIEESEEETTTDDDLLSMLLDQEQAEADIKKLNIIIKSSTQGTLEAVEEKLNELSDEDVEVNIIDKSTGPITLKDIQRARSTRSIIIGFQTHIGSDMETIAKRERVPFRLYEIIYELIDEVSLALDSLVEPVEEEVEVARARVKKVFVLTNGKIVAGSEVIKGTVLKGYSTFVERKGEEIGRGKIVSLKQSKEEVREIKKGQECGIIIEPEVKIEEGDEIVCFKIEKI